MKQNNDADGPPREPTRASGKGLLTRHRLGLLGAGLLGILAIAGIAKAVPLVAHPIGCMGGQHNPASDEAAIPDANGKVSIVVDESGFRPSSVQMKKGQKVTLEFRRTTDRTCATSVAFPDLELEKPLPLNQTVVVELPASLSSTLTFQCGMGMYHGKVVVH